MTVIQYKESGNIQSAEVLDADTAVPQLNKCIKTETNIIRKADCASKLAMIYNEGLLGKVSRTEAIKNSESAYELVPDDMIYVHNLGLAYYNAGSYKKAEPLLKRCAEANPDKLNNYNKVTCASKLGWMYFAGQLGGKDLKKAVANYKIANRLEPDNSVYANNLAHCANKIGIAYAKGKRGQKADLDKAFEYHELAHKVVPNEIIYNNHLADTCYKLGRYEQAKILYENCLNAELTSSFSNINKADCANTLSSIYRSEQEFDKALENLVKAYEFHPTNNVYTHNLAINYFDYGNYPKASALFRQCANGDLTEHFTESVRDACIEGVRLSGEALREL